MEKFHSSFLLPFVCMVGLCLYTLTIMNPYNVFYGYRLKEASFLERFEGKGEKKLAQDDPILIKYVRENYIFPPSNGPLNLVRPKVRDQAMTGDTGTVLSLLGKIGGKQIGGFFIEAGAYDGERMSNTLMLERYHKWTGLLVEADKTLFAKLKNKKRNAWIANVGLSINPYPEKINITDKMLYGRNTTISYGEWQTIPLWTLLLAIKQTEIDFMSLDVELLTHAVLKTLPLDRVNIKVAIIETVLEPDSGKAMRKHLEVNGFNFHKYIRTRVYHDNRINDIIVYKNVSK